MTTSNSQGGGLRALFRFGPWVGAAALLALPAIAVRYSTEVAWTTFDFLFAGGMFLAVLIPWELAMRTGRDLAFLVGCAIALGLGFLTVWFTGAVGIIGSEDNPANFMFFGVLAVALLGTVFSGFKAKGMSLAMVAAAAAQLLVGAIAYLGNMGVEGESWPKDVIGLTGVFTLLWVLAGGLLRHSSRTSSGAPAREPFA